MSGHRPLQLALKMGEVAELLIGNGADLDHKDRSGALSKAYNLFFFNRRATQETDIGSSDPIGRR
jgi:hypothetical protein